MTSLAERIRADLEAFEMTAPEISQKFGCRVEYVRAVASRAGLPVPRVKNRASSRYRFSLCLQAEDAAFVAGEASRLNVSFSTVIAAIVTDARSEAEGQQQKMVAAK